MSNSAKIKQQTDVVLNVFTRLQRYQRGNHKHANEQLLPNERRTKGQTMIYKTLHRKLKIEQRETQKKRKRTQVLWKGKQLFRLHRCGCYQQTEGSTCNDV